MNQVSPIAQLSLEGAGLGISILTNTGTLNAVPNATQFPGCNIFNLFVVSLVILGTISLIYSTSVGCIILNIKKLLHCDKEVSDNSDGLCEIRPNNTPYFLPSLVILSNILYPNKNLSLSF